MKFRLIYNDGKKSAWIDARSVTLKYLNYISIAWREKFKDYQIEYKRI